MERIEYVLRMEDYVEGITRSLVHLRGAKKNRMRKDIQNFLTHDAIILGIL